MNLVIPVALKSVPLRFPAILLACGLLGVWIAISSTTDSPLIDNPFASLLPAGMTFLAFHIPGRSRAVAAGAVIMSWFSMALGETWGNVRTEGYLIAGLFPFSDAGAYYHEATRLVGGEDFSSWGSRRPLAGLYLSAALGASGENLRLALFILNSIAAFCVALTAISIRNLAGAAASAIFVWMVFLYYRRYCGVFSSEVGGLTWGLLSLWLLLQSINTRSLATACMGLAALSLGSNIRAGALLVLPMLFLWILITLKRGHRVWRIVVIGAVAMTAGFVASTTVTSAVGSKDGVLFSNYAQTLYGVVFDGDWTKCYTDHPSINSMSERERTAYLYRIIWNEVGTNPASLARGLVRGWTEFLTRPHSGLSPFDFIRSVRAETFVYLSSIIGSVALIFRARSDLLARLILAGNFGILLSVSLVPTRDADNMRAYATTMPWLCLLPCGLLLAWKKRDETAPDWAPSKPTAIMDRTAAGISGGLAAGMLLLPLFFRYVTPLSPQARISPHLVLTWTPNAGSYLRIDDSGRREGIPVGRLTAGITQWTDGNYPGLRSVLSAYDRPGVLVAGGGDSGAGLLLLNASNTSSNVAVQIKGIWVRPIPTYNAFFVDSSLVPEGGVP
jgi:hypothetical protein